MMVFQSLFILIVIVSPCSSMNYKFARRLYDTALSNYTRHVKPRQLSADVVDVNVEFDIHAVIDYDEKSGVFVFQGKFILRWWDEMIMWNKSDHGNIDMVQLSIHDVWVPKIVIGNSISYHSLYKFDNYFDSKMIYVTYMENGAASISSSGVWETSCNSDVSKFPFDVHDCVVQLDALEPIRDIQLMSKSKGVNVNATSMHSEFKIKETSLSSEPLHADLRWSQLTYIIKLERKPLFMMMNLVVPVYIISLANLLVFLLPLDSSDRVAFSVTMLLTFTVFMTMVTDELPATDKLSHFNTFLLLQLVFSTVITVCVLFIHYIYRKEDETHSTPKWIDWITNRRKSKENMVQPLEKHFEIEKKSTWKKIARMVNKVLLVTFSIVILAEFAYFYFVISV